MIAMRDALTAVLAIAAGAGLGAIYFAGLWWTVRRAGSFRRPALSMLVSSMLRMSVTLAGFYLVASDSWQRLLLCLLGFIVARATVTWLLRPAASFEAAATAEMRHAP